MIRAFICMAILLTAWPETAFPTTEAALDASIEKRMARARIVGLVAGIAGPEGLIWSRAYGHSSLKKKTRLRTDTIFPVASVSKTVTSTAMMMQVEAGALSLDADVNTYLPFRVDNPHVTGERITLRHLGTHTSGIQDRSAVYESPISYHYGGDNPMPMEDFLREYITQGGRFADPGNFLPAMPGKRFRYCNICAGLMAHVVEQTSGASFNEFTRRRLFEPLEMRSTGWFYSEIDRSRHVTLYRSDGGDWVALEPYGLVTWPDGGLRTTVSDLANFLAMIINGGSFRGRRVLSEQSVEQMLRPVQLGEHELADAPSHARQGLFWMHQQLGGRAVVGHTGDDPGLGTRMHFDPAQRIGVIVFVNVESSQAAQVLEATVEDLFRFALSGYTRDFRASPEYGARRGPARDCGCRCASQDFAAPRKDR